MIDLNKLSQFNVNDIDTEKIVSVLLEHQNTLIKVLLVAVSLFFLVNMFNGHRLKEQNLRKQMSDVQDKLLAIKTRDASTGELNSFMSAFPKKLNEFELIGIVSNCAKSNHISIPSLSPSLSKDMGLFDEIDIGFVAQADSFKEMELFLRKVEESNASIRIDSWTGQENEKGQISFSVNLSAVIMHS